MTKKDIEKLLALVAREPQSPERDRLIATLRDLKDNIDRIHFAQLRATPSALAFIAE